MANMLQYTYSTTTSYSPYEDGYSPATPTYIPYNPYDGYTPIRPVPSYGSPLRHSRKDNPVLIL